jgi:type VI secretion system secreted protein VgrG
LPLTAKQNIKLNAEGKDLSLTSGQDLIIEAGKDMSVRVMDGDSTITVQQGSLSIDAANSINIISEGGPITIEQGGGKIEMSDGKVSIQGNTVSIEGNSVAVTGQSVQMMGGGGAAAVASKAMAAAVATTLFDDKFKLLDNKTGQPLTQTDYAVKRASGDIEHGTTDDVGHTHLLSSIAKSESIAIFI